MTIIGWLERKYIILGIIIILALNSLGFFHGFFNYELGDFKVGVIIGITALYPIYLIKQDKI